MSTNKKRQKGFTLVEMLVVIAIIALLAAIVIPALSGAMKASKKARAMRQVQDIHGAIERYWSEYNRMPVPREQKHGGNDIRYKEDNNKVINILMAKDIATWSADDIAVTNPKRLAFLDLDARSLAEYSANADGLKDPWGNYYELMMDMNFDNVINDATYGDIRARIAVFSMGADGQTGDDKKGKDDLKTW